MKKTIILILIVVLILAFAIWYWVGMKPSIEKVDWLSMTANVKIDGHLQPYVILPDANVRAGKYTIEGYYSAGALNEVYIKNEQGVIIDKMSR